MSAPQLDMFGPRPVASPAMVRDEERTSRPAGVLSSLRPYQLAAVEGVHAKLAQHASSLLVMPTGTGKTRTAGAIVKAWPGPVVWLAHRDELIQQAVADLRKHTGEYVSVEKADDWARGARVVVGSVQTLKGDRLASFARRHPATLVMIDEAHHATAKSYRAIVAAFEGAKLLGVTATPDRADKMALGQVFQAVAFSYQINDAIGDGWLVPIRVTSVDVKAIDLSSVATVAGDLNQGQLDQVMSAEEALHGVVKPTVELAGERRTIVFTTSVANAHRMAEIFNRYRPGSARAVDGETEAFARRRLLNDHKSGAFQYLVNVGIATEGYDDPGVACVAMARPTKSRALYTQCAGRGLRTLPGVDGAEDRRAWIASSGKPDCLLLDFVGNAGKHSLVSALDVLGGKYSDDVKKRAKKIAEKTPGMLAEEALEKAQKEADAKAEREAAKRAAVKAKKVDYTATAVDPFSAALNVLGMQPRNDEHGVDANLPPLLGDVQYLSDRGVDLPPNATRQQARRLANTLRARARLGLATFKQVRQLRRAGVPNPTNVTFVQARLVMDAVAANGWRPLPIETLMGLLGREPGQEG